MTASDAVVTVRLPNIHFFFAPILISFFLHTFQMILDEKKFIKKCFLPKNFHTFVLLVTGPV